MVTYAVNIGLNKIAVAEEVVTSAAKILLAAGFDHDEVADLLRQAADQVAQSVDVPRGAISHEMDKPITDDILSVSDAYEVIEKYEEILERKALARLSKRASALGYSHDDEYVIKTMEILEQALPLAEKAQGWLMSECAATEIQIEPSKDEWLETASDEELDREHEIVFLDDWQISGDFQLDKIEILAGIFARTGDVDRYKKLIELIAANKVLYGDKILKELAKTGDAFESMSDFMSFLADHAGEGEIQQSTLLDEYLARSGFSGGTYILEGWLQSLADGGKIQRYKRSSRWRIVIGSA